MNNRPWFRPRKFGVGWTPATWEGWLVTLLGMAFVMGANLLLISRLAPPHR